MFIPNTNRKPLGKELLMERWKALANDGRQVVQESSKGTSSRATLMHKVKGADGLTYGILQENTHFFLKKTTAAFETAQSADFEYIGGTQNILAERFTSASDAHRRLNAKLWSLRESVGAPQSSEEELLGKLNQKDDEEAQAPAEAPVDNAMPAEGGAEADPLAGLDDAGAAPEAGAADGAPVDAPAEGGAEADPLAGLDDAGAGAEAPAADGAPVEDGAADDLGLDAEGGEGGEAPADGEAPAEDGGGEDGASDVQTKLGQLTQAMKVSDISPDFLLSALNSLLTVGDRIMPQLAPEDKEKLKQRIDKDGKKIDEDETPRSLSASHQNSAAEHRRNAADPKNGYRNSEIAAAKDDLEGSAYNREQAKPLPEAWDDHNDSAYQNNERNMGNEQGAVPGYLEFMENGGFSDKDDDVIKGIEAFSKSLWERDAEPTEQDLQAMAKEMNPYIWSNLSNTSESIINGLAKIGGVDMENDGEWPVAPQTGQALVKPQAPQAPLNEGWGSVAALTRLLVRSELNKSKI